MRVTPRLLSALGLVAALGALAAVPAARGKAGHAGWPERTGILPPAADRGTTIPGTRRNDELLGGHGSDRLIGGRGGDVLWGDWHPSGNTAGQHDTMLGGPGRDFIYTSHGRN